MSELTIDSLPDEMLIEIFNNLDEATLVTASKCCMRFDDLICNDVSLMKKIEYGVIMMDSIKQFKIFKAFEEGKYQNLFFGACRYKPKVLDKIPKLLLEDIKKYKNSLRKITFSDVTTSACVDVLSCLELTNNLILANLLENQEENVNLENLEHLEVYESFKFLKFIKNHNLKSLKINLSEGFLIFNNFLKSCDNLKELSISTNQFNSITINFESLNFKLTKLSLKNVSLSDENLLKFLELHEETLKELSIVNEKQNYLIKNSLEFILNQMSLKYFETNINSLQNFDYSLNETIQRLVIWDLKTHEPFFRYRNSNSISLPERLLRFEKILTTCEKVKDLTILSCENLNEVLQVISKSMPWLKILKLQKVPDILSPLINLDSLDHLEIDLIETDKQLEVLPYLVAYCGNLKILKVNEFKREENEECVLKKIILSAKKLEEVYVGIECDFPDSIKLILQQMKSCRRSLRILKSKNFKLTRDDPKKSLKYESSSFFCKNDLKCYGNEVERNYSLLIAKCARLAVKKIQRKYFSDK